MWKIIIIKPNECMNLLMKADKCINTISNLNKCVMSPPPPARLCVAVRRLHVHDGGDVEPGTPARFPAELGEPRHVTSVGLTSGPAGWLAGWLVDPGLAAPHPLGSSPFFLPPTSRCHLHPRPHVQFFPAV